MGKRRLGSDEEELIIDTDDDNRSRKKKKRSTKKDDAVFDFTQSDSKKKGPKKPKKKKQVFKKLEALADLDLSSHPSWYFICTSEYMIFSPFGKNTACEVIGIDIGTKHLGITGLAEFDNRKLAVTTFESLVSYPSKNVHECVDKMVDLLYGNELFRWFRDADHYRIELQMQV